MTPDEFSTKIKAKYPTYAGMDNTELATKIIAKYPTYKDQVDFTSQPTQPQTPLTPEVAPKPILGGVVDKYNPVDIASKALTSGGEAASNLGSTVMEKSKGMQQSVEGALPGAGGQALGALARMPGDVAGVGLKAIGGASKLAGEMLDPTPENFLNFMLSGGAGAPEMGGSGNLGKIVDLAGASWNTHIAGTKAYGTVAELAGRVANTVGEAAKKMGASAEQIAQATSKAFEETRGRMAKAIQARDELGVRSLPSVEFDSPALASSENVLKKLFGSGPEFNKYLDTAKSEETIQKNLVLNSPLDRGPLPTENPVGDQVGAMSKSVSDLLDRHVAAGKMTPDEAKQLLADHQPILAQATRDLIDIPLTGKLSATEKSLQAKAVFEKSLNKAEENTLWNGFNRALEKQPELNKITDDSTRKLAEKLRLDSPSSYSKLRSFARDFEIGPKNIDQPFYTVKQYREKLSQLGAELDNPKIPLMERAKLTQLWLSGKAELENKFKGTSLESPFNAATTFTKGFHDKWDTPGLKALFNEDKTGFVEGLASKPTILQEIIGKVPEARKDFESHLDDMILGPKGSMIPDRGQILAKLNQYGDSLKVIHGKAVTKDFDAAITRGELPELLQDKLGGRVKDVLKSYFPGQALPKELVQPLVNGDAAVAKAFRKYASADQFQQGRVNWLMDVLNDPDVAKLGEDAFEKRLRSYEPGFINAISSPAEIEKIRQVARAGYAFPGEARAKPGMAASFGGAGIVVDDEAWINSFPHMVGRVVGMTGVPNFLARQFLSDSGRGLLRKLFTTPATSPEATKLVKTLVQGGFLTFVPRPTAAPSQPQPAGAPPR